MAKSLNVWQFLSFKGLDLARDQPFGKGNETFWVHSRCATVVVQWEEFKGNYVISWNEEGRNIGPRQWSLLPFNTTLWAQTIVWLSPWFIIRRWPMGFMKFSIVLSNKTQPWPLSSVTFIFFESYSVGYPLILELWRLVVSILTVIVMKWSTRSD